MAQVNFRINGTSKILLGFRPALFGQFGGNISFVVSRDLGHEVPPLFGT